MVPVILQWTCQVCSKQFKMAWLLRRHMKTVHMKIRHQCYICLDTYSRQDHLREHIQKKHPQQIIARDDPWLIMKKITDVLIFSWSSSEHTCLDILGQFLILWSSRSQRVISYILILRDHNITWIIFYRCNCVLNWKIKRWKDDKIKNGRME